MDTMTGGNEIEPRHTTSPTVSPDGDTAAAGWTAARVGVAAAALVPDPSPPVASLTPDGEETGGVVGGEAAASTCSDSSSSTSPPLPSDASSASLRSSPSAALPPASLPSRRPAHLSASSQDSDWAPVDASSRLNRVSDASSTPTAAGSDPAPAPAPVAPLPAPDRTLECDDFDGDSSSASDDIRDAMTKTALCSCLFTLTRTGKLTLHQSNLLSKALCSRSSTLRAFEKLLMQIRVAEAEANTRQEEWSRRQKVWNDKHQPKSRRSFFGLGPRTPTASAVAGGGGGSGGATIAFPEASPLSEAKREGERLVWLWVAEQMAAIMPASAVCNSLPVSPSNGGGGGGGTHRSLFSHSSPSMPSTAHRPLLSSLQPVQILPDSAPHTRSHSTSGQQLAMMAGVHVGVSASNSPASTPRSPALSTSSSFAQGHGQGSMQLERAHSVLSPRRLFRALFYSSAGGMASASASTASSNASTPKFGPASSPTGGMGSPYAQVGAHGPIPSPLSQLRARSGAAASSTSSSSLDLEACTQHFESFPRISDLLQELVISPLPPVVLQGFEAPSSLTLTLTPPTPSQPLLPQSPGDAGADSDATAALPAPALGAEPHADESSSTPLSPSHTPASSAPASTTTTATATDGAPFPIADWLVLHTAFPFPVPSPLARFDLSREEQTDEATVLAAWNDVLLNYRKHVPLSKLNAAAVARAAAIRDGPPPQRFTSAAAVLLEWWLTTWRQADSDSWAGSEHLAGAHSHLGALSPPQSLTLPHFASALSPDGDSVGHSVGGGLTSPLALGTPAHAALDHTPLSPPMFPASPPHLRLSCSDESQQREGQGEGDEEHSSIATTPAGAGAAPHVAGPSLHRMQLRLLLLLSHWLFLCPHDFKDKNCMTRLNTFLLEQQSRFSTTPLQPPSSPAAHQQQSASGTDDASATPPAAPTAAATLPIHPVLDLLRQLQSMLLRCSSPSFQLDASGRPAASSPSSSPLSSPLQLVSYPFSEEVDAIYSSSLFSYPPAALAQELLLHSYDLFRRVPLDEWMDGAWQNKSAVAGGMPGNPAAARAYTNAYSLATNPPSERGADGSASHPPSTATSALIGDFNRLVFWMSTEILHPRLSAHQRQQLVLYFLELAFISWHVHHNFHVVFAVAATFANQAIYRLAEVAALEHMELRYANAEVSRLAEEDAAAAAEAASRAASEAENDEDSAAAAAVAAAAAQAAAAAAAGTSVKSQFSSLKTLTSSRNNYATYRTLISTLLGEQAAHGASGSSVAPPSGHALGHWMGTTPCATSAAATPFASVPSTPMMGAMSANSSRRPSDASLSGLVSPAGDSPARPPVDFPSAAQAQQQQQSSQVHSPLLSFSLLGEGSMSVPACGGGVYRRRVVTLVPHLAVHLKDLTYTQELSGVEVQWMDEQVQAQATTNHSAQQQHRTDAPTATPGSLALPSSSPASSSDSPPLPAAPALLSCRFDRSRWRRTTRLICQLLRFQSLPIFSSALSLHVPALYTLLQVHLLTHVLPESELQSLSFAIVPRADRARIKQQQVQKKTLTALQEEGLM